MKQIYRFLYTGFYSGYSPIAPGTAGTLVAVALYILIYLLFKENVVWINAAIVFLTFFPAMKLGDIAEKELGKKDPQVVVLDEMIGYWIALLFFQFNIAVVIAAFVLFRIFDIVKPPPIRQLQSFKGGFGIMIDDYLAGLLSNLVIRIALFLLAHKGIVVY